MTTDPRLRLAVFIDFDNIEIGVRSTLQAAFDAGIVLEALRERGDVVSKTAYSDWQRAGGYSRVLTQHAIKMVQRNLTPGGDKNGADINLALDALEMAFTHPHINAFVIVGGDSDFISLVEKLKQYDKKVFIVGGRQFTSAILQRNCHEFIAYENLLAASAGAGGGAQRSASRSVPVERMPLEQATPLVRRALAVLSEREVSPQLGVLKSTLLQLDSTFSERNYGAGSFRDFVEKLAKAGVLTVYQAKGGWMVGTPDGPPAGIESSGEEETPARPVAPPAGRGPAPAPIAAIGTPAEGLQIFRRLLADLQGRRWPMYLRHIKQICRQASPPFDERAYEYANLIDLLRAAQKDGFVRIERDRQGVVRVFQGASPASPPPDLREDAAEPAAPTAPVPEPEPAPEAEPDLSVGPGNSVAEPTPAAAAEAPRRRPRAAAPRRSSPRPRSARRKAP